LALSGIRQSLGMKFALVAPLAVTLCFLVGYFAKMLPIVKRIL
jgi:hypothetical protein